MYCQTLVYVGYTKKISFGVGYGKFSCLRFFLVEKMCALASTNNIMVILKKH